MNRKMNQKEIGHILYRLIFHIIMVIMIFFSVAVIRAKQEHHVINLFGYGIYTLEDTKVEVSKEMILLRILTPKDREKILMGERVAYYDDGNQGIVIKKVDAIYELDKTSYYIMEPTDEQMLEPLIEAHDILAKEIGAIKHLGWILIWIQTSFGFVLTMIIPILIYLGFEIKQLIVYVTQHHLRKIESDCKRKAKEKVQEVEEFFAIAKKMTT